MYVFTFVGLAVPRCGNTMTTIIQDEHGSTYSVDDGGTQVRPLSTKPNSPDLQFLKELTAAGKVAPVVDHTYPLGEVPEAVRYLEEGHARGKLVITLYA
jgi:NADPH:quinone reductase-like Zn-dependent oxidoreductase